MLLSRSRERRRQEILSSKRRRHAAIFCRRRIKHVEVIYSEPGPVPVAPHPHSRPPRVNCISGSSHISPPSCIKNTFLQLVLLWFILYTLGNEWGCHGSKVNRGHTLVTLLSAPPRFPPAPGGPLRALIHPCVCGPAIEQRLACSPLDFKMIFLVTLYPLCMTKERKSGMFGGSDMWDSSRLYFVFC